MACLINNRKITFFWTTLNEIFLFYLARNWLFSNVFTLLKWLYHQNFDRSSQWRAEDERTKQMITETAMIFLLLNLGKCLLMICRKGFSYFTSLGFLWLIICVKFTPNNKYIILNLNLMYFSNYVKTSPKENYILIST